jgi:hypothetical protein
MKPILFSTPMVQAILEGRKTMTRRVIKQNSTALNWLNAGFTLEFICNEGNEAIRPYNVGDILWVRETFENYQGAYNYKAGKYGLLGEKWKPSIFMPKEAARIFLRVADVRIEKLQDISEEDAIAEGIETEKEDVPVIPYKDYLGKYNYYSNPINSFKSLWEFINGEQSWEDNPYVWVISFEETFKPEIN